MMRLSWATNSGIRQWLSATGAWDELDEQEIRLLNMASRIYTCAVDLVLLDSQVAVVQLRSSVKAARYAVQHIATLKEALDLASALILFAAAVSSGNAAAIPTAVVL
jgi:hypothetical protein